MLKGHRNGEILSQRVPPQVTFFEELLHVLGGRSSCASLEQAAASQQRHYGQHLRRRAQLQYGEKVGQIVSQDVSGDGDGVQAFFRSLATASHRMNYRHWCIFNHSSNVDTSIQLLSNLARGWICPARSCRGGACTSSPCR